MKSEIQIKDLVIPFKELDGHTSVGDALNDLESSNLEYGVIKDTVGKLIALVDAERLRSWSNSQDNLSSVIDRKPPPLVAGAEITIDKAVQEFASHFVVNREHEGVVVKENDVLKGVLPRRAIIKRALQIVSSRGADRLEGSPLDTAYYECLLDNERKRVDYYDPSNPPICAKGHKMVLVEN